MPHKPHCPVPVITYNGTLVVAAGNKYPNVAARLPANYLTETATALGKLSTDTAGQKTAMGETGNLTLTGGGSSLAKTGGIVAFLAPPPGVVRSRPAVFRSRSGVVRSRPTVFRSPPDAGFSSFSAKKAIFCQKWPPNRPNSLLNDFSGLRSGQRAEALNLPPVNQKTTKTPKTTENT